MKLIKPYYEIIEQQPGEIGMLKHIEAQGRVAWKSEDRITDDSYLKFIEMLKGVNHCYIEGTEILTEKGWVKFEKYNNEKVAVKNKDCTLKGFEIPTNYIKDTYTGTFYHYKTIL